MNKSPKQKSNVDSWLEEMTPEQWEALDHAAKQFPENSAYNLYTLEGIYGQESSFGKRRGKKNTDFAAGDFKIEKKLAIKKLGLKVSSKLDERFDINKASLAAAKYINILDRSFSKETFLDGDLKTVPIKDPSERVNFVLAAYNAGPGRIANAQRIAKESGKDPTKWSDVKEFLEQAGIHDSKQLKEKREYPDKVQNYAEQFKRKSQPDGLPPRMRWITKDGRHILIRK